MAYKVAIDTETNNENLSKLSNYISSELTRIGIDNYLVNASTNEGKVNSIKSTYGTGNNVIVLSNKTGSSGIVNIMYPLRSNNKLAASIASNLENVISNEIRYYQLRSSSDTSVDYDYLIRNTPNNLTLVIDYGNANLSNYENIAKNIVKSIASYAGISYNPDLGDGYYVVKKGDAIFMGNNE